MDKVMIGCFHSLLAKGAKSTIWPSTLLKSIGRPKTVLNGKSSVVFGRGGRPSIQYQGIHVGENKAKELKLVSRQSGIKSIIHKLPNSGVFNVNLQMHMVDKAAKLNKLEKMVQSEGPFKIYFLDPSPSFMAWATFQFLRLEDLKIKGATSLGDLPSSQGACQKGFLQPFPMVMVVAA
jgi:hypothetical protein